MPASTTTLPTIVLIVLDAVRQDHLSCYGHERQTTPNIDRLAAEGVQFMQAYSSSCWTIPSHASLFTGLYPSQHRADFDTQTLHPQHITLASYLNQLGYHTACISCNSFIAGGFSNLNRGFDLTVDVEGGYRQGHDLLSRGLRFAQKRWRLWAQRDRGARRATQLALDWLSRQSNPGFLFINYMDCHLPYRLKSSECYRFVGPEDRQRADRVPMDPFAVMAGELAFSPDDISALERIYDGCLAYLDQQVAELVEGLKRMGLYDETIFIVTSDHGESFGEHGLFDHQYGLYENLVKVPLIIRFPQGRLAGYRSRHLIQHVDLFPLLASLLDASEAGQAAGLIPPLDVQREFVLAEYPVPNLRAFQRRFPQADTSRFDMPLRSILKGQNKLIIRRDGQRELYDLSQDPQESKNLAGHRPVLADQLQSLIFTMLGPWSQDGPQEPGAALDDEIRERLESLGYL